MYEDPIANVYELKTIYDISSGAVASPDLPDDVW